MYGCESWSIKKAEHQRIDAFELWCWRRLLRVPWTARRSNQLILKEISPKYSLEGLMLKAKYQYILATWCEELTHWKSPWCGKDWRREEKGMTEDEKAGWHHQFDGCEFKWTPGVVDGQGNLKCCIHGVTENQTRLRDWTELNWTELYNCEEFDLGPMLMV